MCARARSSLFVLGAVALAGALGSSGTSTEARQAASAPRLTSRVTIYDLDTRSAHVVYEGTGVWEAPNWARDGSSLLVNSGGRLYRIPVAGGEPVALNLATDLRANNDHDFSADGSRLAISASSPGSGGSQIFVADADGSSHRLVVSTPPSYFHGWSPDGRFLSYVANRDGTQYDVYRIPADGGGAEERLTFDPAYDDGTDYSPDGRWIYFNSNRGGGWNIWRIPADGAGPNDVKAQRVTSDALEDWFPHPSPDGRRLLFLSFPAGTEGHNDRNLEVRLRMIAMPGDPVQDAVPETLVTFTGGQGTINVNSWAPDSRRFAYVSYEPLAETP